MPNKPEKKWRSAKKFPNFNFTMSFILSAYIVCAKEYDGNATQSRPNVGKHFYLSFLCGIADGKQEVDT